MRWKEGRKRLERRAKRPFAEAPLYSNSPRPSLTEKLIVEGCVATPRRSSSSSKPG